MAKKKADPREEIYEKLAIKHKLSVKEVRAICDSQFVFVAKIFKDKKFQAVRLPYFGIWRVAKGRLKYLKEKYGKPIQEDRPGD